MCEEIEVAVQMEAQGSQNATALELSFKHICKT